MDNATVWHPIYFKGAIWKFMTFKKVLKLSTECEEPTVLTLKCSPASPANYMANWAYKLTVAPVMDL